MIFGSLEAGACRAAHAEVLARRGLFNDADAAFFGLSVDPRDRFERGLANAVPGIRYFWDFDQTVCGLFGYCQGAAAQPITLLIDRSFRVVMAEPLARTGAVLDRLQSELSPEPPLESSPHAPVLVLPNILEPEFCETLVGYFEAGEASDSGFAAEVGGRTVTVINAALKRRHDVTIENPALIDGVRERLTARLFPIIKRAFGWQATEIERFLISRYSGAEQGFFSAHRDDVTAGTAHRKFAVSLNLNAGAYEGGALRFPEFGQRTYSPPTGGAAVFCCSLLHEVTPVTEGERYALLPFLFDEDGKRIKAVNASRVGDASVSRRDRRAAMARGRR